MRKAFPEMTDRPESGTVYSTIAYYFLCFVLIPFALPLFAVDIYWNPAALSWLELIYHYANGIIVMLMIREYMGFSWYYVKPKKKEFVKTVVIGAGLALGYAAFCAGVMLFQGVSPAMLMDLLPISELSNFLWPGYLISKQPILGTICMTLVTPFAVAGLFYAPGFAPMACRRSWLGYVSITLLFLMSCGFEYLWHLDFLDAALLFILRMPIHYIACWTYQKSNSIWGPIVTIGIFNLIMSVICIFAYPV